MSTEHLVDYLSSIPRSTLTALRHVRLCSERLKLCLRGSINLTASISEVLALCTGLQLDTLEIKSGTGDGFEQWWEADLSDIQDLSSSNTGFKHLSLTIESQYHQLSIERLIRLSHPDSTSFDQSHPRRTCQIPGLKVGYGTKLKVFRCMTDKEHDCLEKDWRDQTNSAAEEAWKAENESIVYGLRITRDAVPDTVITGVENERGWTLQDFRRKMDTSLVESLRITEADTYTYRLGRGKFRQNVTTTWEWKDPALAAPR